MYQNKHNIFKLSELLRKETVNKNSFSNKNIFVKLNPIWIFNTKQCQTKLLTKIPRKAR
jgi:hypothetical protein